MSPTQSIEYISLGTDTIAMTFSLPQKKVEKLKEIESRLEWIKISVLLRQALHHSKI